jgi:hypothetical protein
MLTEFASELSKKLRSLQRRRAKLERKQPGGQRP